MSLWTVFAWRISRGYWPSSTVFVSECGLLGNDKLSFWRGLEPLRSDRYLRSQFTYRVIEKKYSRTRFVFILMLTNSTHWKSSSILWKLVNCFVKPFATIVLLCWSKQSCTLWVYLLSFIDTPQHLRYVDKRRPFTWCVIPTFLHQSEKVICLLVIRRWRHRTVVGRVVHHQF